MVLWLRWCGEAGFPTRGRCALLDGTQSVDTKCWWLMMFSWYFKTSSSILFGVALFVRRVFASGYRRSSKTNPRFPSPPECIDIHSPLLTPTRHLIRTSEASHTPLSRPIDTYPYSHPSSPSFPSHVSFHPRLSSHRGGAYALSVTPSPHCRYNAVCAHSLHEKDCSVENERVW